MDLCVKPLANAYYISFLREKDWADMIQDGIALIMIHEPETGPSSEAINMCTWEPTHMFS